MSKVVDEDKLYDDDTVKYLHERGLDYKIEENFRKFGPDEPHAKSGGDIDLKGILTEAGVPDPDRPANPTFVDGTNIQTGTVVEDNGQMSTQEAEDVDIEHLHALDGDYSLDEFDPELQDQVKDLTVAECQENLKELGAGPRTGTVKELRWRVAKAVQLAEKG
jgi:hypothetical protein